MTECLNKNATRMLTGLIMGTVAMCCIIYGGAALLLLLLVFILSASKEYVKFLNIKAFTRVLKLLLRL